MSAVPWQVRVMAKNGAPRWKQWTREQGLQALQDWQASVLKMKP